MLHHRLRAASGARGTGGDFDPMDLAPLVFYDPADVSTLWQDATGTNPITTDGQRVRRIDDKSGNGYHASLGSGMIYRTDGYIEASAAYDHLYVDVPVQVYPFFMIGACGRNGLSSEATGAFALANPSSQTAIAFIVLIPGESVGAVNNNISSNVPNTDQKAIVSLQARAGNQVGFCNSAMGNTLNFSQESNLYRLALGAVLRNSPLYRRGENGGFLLFDYDIGDTNRELCEQWLADRYGVTI